MRKKRERETGASPLRWRNEVTIERGEKKKPRPLILSYYNKGGYTGI